MAPRTPLGSVPRHARPRPRITRVALGVLAVLAASTTAAGAQAQGDGFLFGEPSGSLTVRGGFARANAGSSIFDFSRQNLTLGRGDFSGLTLGTDVAFRLSPRFDFVLSADYAGSRTDSEFRHWEDTDGQPIEQRTTFVRVPLTASVRAYLTPRGRSIGRFAWIPEALAPFVGAGGGYMYYSFQQQGSFVDFDTNDIFDTKLRSSGFTPTAHALAGVDYSLSPRYAITTQARYQWGRAKMNADFVNFDRIDLSGLAATVGFYVRF